MKAISPNYFFIIIILIHMIPMAVNANSFMIRNQMSKMEVKDHYRSKINVMIRVLRVPEDYSKLQDAVDAANDDDIIILSRGTYTLNETVVINKSITLASDFINTNDVADVDATVITSGLNLEPLVLFSENAVNSKCIGITFKDARKQLTMECDYMEVVHCKFFDNTSDALSFEGSGGYVAYNYFENCGDEAIDADDSLDWIIEYNTIINPGDDGLEIRLHNNDNSSRLHIIRYNLISGADEDGIQLIDYDGNSGREFQIHHNVIINSAMVGLGCTADGNTVENFEGSNMEEKVFVYNNVFDSNNYSITGARNILVFNNIISNSTTIGVKKLDDNSRADYNCFFENGDDFLNTSNGPNNIFIDPLFNEDYTLQANSPCIDTGIKTFSYNILSQTVSENDILGALPDIGAKEFEEGVLPTNMAPIVSAGTDQVILAPITQVNLDGVITDDGLPQDGRLAAKWSLVMSPLLGSVIFEDPNEASTIATLNTQGTYELKLSAEDGLKGSSDKLTVFFVNDFSDSSINLQGSSFIEAENYRYLVGSAYVIENDEASAGEMVTTRIGEGFYAYSEYQVTTFESGTYYIWINATGPDIDSNGSRVAFNNLEEELLLNATISNSFGEESWVRLVFENIPEGVYPLRISADEEGVSWDRIFITTDQNEEPYEFYNNTPIIYPVPNNGQFTIALNALIPTKIEVFDLLGQLVYSTTVNNTLKVSLDVGTIGLGVFVVSINNAKESINKKMIIK